MRYRLPLVPSGPLVMALIPLFGLPAVGAAQVTVASATDSGTPTFYEEVLPIVQENCQSCHRAGEVAPMSLLTYGDVREEARGIKRMVSAQRMPPWTADNAASVPFHNDRSLSPEQIETIVAWVDGGTPAGDARRAPPQPTFVDGWQMEPDETVQVPVFEIPAEGTVEYTYYIFPEVFEQDRWIKASEMRPTNRSVTHHLLAYVRPPGSSYFRDYPVGQFFIPELSDRSPVEGESGFRWRQSIGGYAPGQNPWESNYPDDQAVFVEAGSQIVFEMHYTTDGEATTDRPKLGLVYLDGEPGTRRLQSTVINRGFEIPANAENHRVDASITLAQSAKLLSLTPHMHLRGKSWEFRAVFPDGTTKVLLSTPRYDFNWQITHYLAEPMVLPAGTVIEGTAHYDNSAGNPHNPDPNSPVGWGDQSWEEMMVGFFDLELPADVDPEKVFGHPGGN